jgi:hypothetical protein
MIGSRAAAGMACAQDNTATGYQALYNNYGSNNTATGYEAGLNVTTGSNHIEIGNEGTATDKNVIRIGKIRTQTKAFIAGIHTNTAVSGLAVVIGSNGELGAVSSSERFKTAIAPLGSNTTRLQQLAGIQVPSVTMQAESARTRSEYQLKSMDYDSPVSRSCLEAGSVDVKPRASPDGD